MVAIFFIISLLVAPIDETRASEPMNYFLINEFYRCDNITWIELHNPNPVVFHMGDFIINFRIVMGLFFLPFATIPANGYLILTNNASAFNANWLVPPSVQVFEIGYAGSQSVLSHGFQIHNGTYGDEVPAGADVSILSKGYSYSRYKDDLKPGDLDDAFNFYAEKTPTPGMANTKTTPVEDDGMDTILIVVGVVSLVVGVAAIAGGAFLISRSIHRE